MFVTAFADVTTTLAPNLRTEVDSSTSLMSSPSLSEKSTVVSFRARFGRHLKDFDEIFGYFSYSVRVDFEQRALLGEVLSQLFVVVGDVDRAAVADRPSRVEVVLERRRK